MDTVDIFEVGDLAGMLCLMANSHWVVWGPAQNVSAD